MDNALAHAAKAQSLAQSLIAGLPRQSGPARLSKRTSNLFRDRWHKGRRVLDVREMNAVLGVDAARGEVEAEGMATYESIVDACLRKGVMPLVVPELKTITLGGAVAGVGIEASSHRHGLVHETVTEMEVLTGDGRLVTCTRDNAHADLFFGFPNSYGTLGYALRLTAKTMPVKRYVHLRHLPFSNAADCVQAVAAHAGADDIDFLEGVAFAPDRLFVTLGRFSDSAPRVSDYTGDQPYYRSIGALREDWLTTRDFIWRWDTDWFWCSRNVGAERPLLRRLYRLVGLGSRTYTRLMRWNSRLKLTEIRDRIRGLTAEAVIQDVDVPIERAGEFLGFYSRDIGVWPVWLCPIGPGPDSERYTLYPLRPRTYMNFGFWDVKRTRRAYEPGHFVRLVEYEVQALGGIKSLYSETCLDRQAFFRMFGGDGYHRLKSKYDPDGTFPDLYEKCVLHA